MKGTTKREETRQYLDHYFNRYYTKDIFNRYFYVDQKTYLPEDVLVKVDICSMMNSLESRSPLLDHKLIEFAVGLPGKYKCRLWGEGKRILKDTFRPMLPAGFVDRSKMGFSAPVPRWLRDDLFHFLKDELLTNEKLHAVINKEPIEDLLSEHRSGEKSHARQLWTLLVFSLWLRLANVSL